MRNSNGGRALLSHSTPANRVLTFEPQKRSLDSIEGLLTIKEVAKKLRPTPPGVRCLVSRRVVPVLKIGRKIVRFRWSEVEAAINRYRVKEVC